VTTDLSITTYSQLAQILANQWQVVLTIEHQQQLALYYQVLMDHNSRVNLTRIPDEATFIQRHVLDSLTLWPLIRDVPVGSHVVDVGSGGGFPLIPLAIARPDLCWHSIEATKKKVVCLQAMAKALSLTIHFHADRLETLNKHPDHQGQYAVVMARAVADLSTLLPWVSPLLAPDGQFYAMKGLKGLEELANAGPTLQRLKRRCVAQHQWPHIPSLSDATILVFA
jgi:16S rRNA (guanine527-N7)-methyltransferase